MKLGGGTKRLAVGIAVGMTRSPWYVKWLQLERRRMTEVGGMRFEIHTKTDVNVLSLCESWMVSGAIYVAGKPMGTGDSNCCFHDNIHSNVISHSVARPVSTRKPIVVIVVTLMMLDDDGWKLEMKVGDEVEGGERIVGFLTT